MLRLLLAIGAALAVIPASAAEMPKDFVYLSDVDPSIEQDMRYAGADNFTGRKVLGYDAPECVLVRQAAEALKAVQAEVKAKGLSLKVYDCYRPRQAVAAFVAKGCPLSGPRQGGAVSARLHRRGLGPLARRHHGPHADSAPRRSGSARDRRECSRRLHGAGGEA
jgi:D-alanyl-D-alanine dipeptidase